MMFDCGNIINGYNMMGVSNIFDRYNMTCGGNMMSNGYNMIAGNTMNGNLIGGKILLMTLNRKSMFNRKIKYLG